MTREAAPREAVPEGTAPEGTVPEGTAPEGSPWAGAESAALRVGVLGLGRMGSPMAARLAAAGLRVSASDPAAAVPPGVEQVPDAQDLARGTDVLVTILPTTDVVRAALSGRAGALAALRPGALWMDCSSTDPRVFRSLAEEAGSRGIATVAAPLRGGPGDAAAGDLGFYLSGDAAALRRVVPLLDALGRTERRHVVGADPAAGHTAKLLANTLWFGQAVAAAEVLLLGRAAGLDVERLGAILRASPGGSAFLEHDLDALLDGDYLAAFGIDRVVEELDTVTGLAEAAGTPHDVTRVVADLHRAALDRYGPLDGELLAVRLLEERAGALLRRTTTTDDEPDSHDDRDRQEDEET